MRPVCMMAGCKRRTEPTAAFCAACQRALTRTPRLRSNPSDETPKGLRSLFEQHAHWGLQRPPHAQVADRVLFAYKPEGIRRVLQWLPTTLALWCGIDFDTLYRLSSMQPDDFDRINLHVARDGQEVAISVRFEMLLRVLDRENTSTPCKREEYERLFIKSHSLDHANLFLLPIHKQESWAQGRCERLEHLAMMREGLHKLPWAGPYDPHVMRLFTFSGDRDNPQYGRHVTDAAYEKPTISMWGTAAFYITDRAVLEA